MSGFRTFHIRLGAPQPQGIRIPPPLPDPRISDSLRRKFRKSLLDTPRFFIGKVQLEGFPLILFEWVELCKTAG